MVGCFSPYSHKTFFSLSLCFLILKYFGAQVLGCERLFGCSCHQPLVSLHGSSPSHKEASGKGPSTFPLQVQSVPCLLPSLAQGFSQVPFNGPWPAGPMQQSQPLPPWQAIRPHRVSAPVHVRARFKECKREKHGTHKSQKRNFFHEIAFHAWNPTVCKWPKIQPVSNPSFLYTLVDHDQ